MCSPVGLVHNTAELGINHHGGFHNSCAAISSMRTHAGAAALDGAAGPAADLTPGNLLALLMPAQQAWLPALLPGQDGRWA